MFIQQGQVYITCYQRTKPFSKIILVFDGNSNQHIDGLYQSSILKIFIMKQQQQSVERQQPLEIPADTCHKTDEDKSEIYLEWTEIKAADNLAAIAKRFIPVLNGEIHYDPNSEFYSQIMVRIIRHSRRYDFVDVQVKLGHFIFPRISILNIEAQSPVHEQKQMIGKGAFCQVYRCNYKDRKIVVKCFPLKNRPDREEYFFKMALQQYCILKIASLIKAGPKMEDVFGFNIVCYRYCIEITMELCKQIQFKSKTLLRKEVIKISQALKQSLVNLHSLNIIHFDIKFENICYSPAFERYIFIDFGLSQLIKQGYGLKTFTGFRGSCTSSSPEMQKLYRNESRGFIDLYYNDMHGLKATLTYMIERTEEIVVCSYYDFGEPEITINLEQLYKTYFLQYFLFQQKPEHIFHQIVKEKNQEIILKLLNFLKDFDYSQRLRQIKFYLQGKVKGFQESLTDVHGEDLSIDSNCNMANEIKLRIMNRIDSLCQNNSLDFYLSHLGQNRQKNCFLQDELLMKPQVISQLPIEDYLVILSKAIQVNSTPFYIQQIGRICFTALVYLKIKRDKYDSSKRDIYELTKISVFLFEQSFKHKLEGKYLRICLSMLNNAVILRLYSFEQLFAFYRLALDFPLDFPSKVRLLLNFNSSFRWLGYQCDDYNEAIQSNNGRYAINKQFFDKISKNQVSVKKINLIQAVLEFKQLKQVVNQLDDGEILPLIGQDHELLIDIKLWVVFRAIKFNPNNDEGHLINIRYLLKQKSYYSNEKILYIQYGLLGFYIRKKSHKNLRLFLMQYDKVHVLGPNTVSIMLKAVIQLQRKNYQQKDIENFLEQVRVKLKSTSNIIVIRYLCDELSNIFQLVDLQQQIQDAYNFLKTFTLKNNQIKTKMGLLGKLQNINGMICLQLQLSRKLPKKALQNKKISQKRKIYFASYLSLKRQLSQDSKNISKMDNLMMIMVLSLILYYTNNHKKLLELIDRTYIVAKSMNIPQIMLKFLDCLLMLIAYYTPNPQRQSLFGRYYLLHKQIVQAQNQIFRYFRQAYIVIEIIDILYKTDRQQLLKFIKKICENLRIYNSKTNMNCFFMISQVIFERNNKSQHFFKTNEFLKSALVVRENPFYIIWLYMIQVVSLKNSKQIDHFMTQFGLAANNLVLEIRQKMFGYILLFYLGSNFKKIHLRKLKKLFLILIRNQFFWMSKTQVYRLCKKLFSWQMKNQTLKSKFRCLSRKICRVSQSGNQSIRPLNNIIKNRWIQMIQYAKTPKKYQRLKRQYQEKAQVFY